MEPAQDRSAIIRTLLWITGGANTVLVGLIAAGYGGQFLLVVLFLVDLGLLLVWSAIGHRWMLQLGERIGERIAERRSRS